MKYFYDLNFFRCISWKVAIKCVSFHGMIMGLKLV